MNKSIKQIIKENKATIIVGGVFTVTSFITALVLKGEIDDLKLEISQFKDDADSNLGVICTSVNDLARALNVKDEDWKYMAMLCKDGSVKHF